MNEEIKEILEIFKQVDLEDDVCCYNCPRKDKNKTCVNCLNNAKDKLLDYITNLQHTEDLYNQLLKDYDELQQRIEKAVEYIKSKEDNLFMSFSDDLLGHDELIDKKIGMTLLNILNGRSDE